MGRKPSEITILSTSRVIPRILWNPKVHCRTHNSLLPYPHPEPDKTILKSIPFQILYRSVRKIAWTRLSVRPYGTTRIPLDGFS